MHGLLTSRWGAAFAGPVVRPPNFYLLRQGAAPTSLYVLDEGVIKMVHVTGDGDECVVDIRRAPTIVGGAFIIARRPSITDTITVTRCSVRWCSAEAFLSALADDALCLDDVLRWHSAEVVSLWERASVMSLRTSRQRLKHVLARHGRAGKNGEPALSPPFTQSLLAALINVTPEHLSRLLKKMARHHVV